MNSGVDWRDDDDNDWLCRCAFLIAFSPFFLFISPTPSAAEDKSLASVLSFRHPPRRGIKIKIEFLIIFSAPKLSSLIMRNLHYTSIESIAEKTTRKLLFNKLEMTLKLNLISTRWQSFFRFLPRRRRQWRRAVNSLRRSSIWPTRETMMTWSLSSVSALT